MNRRSFLRFAAASAAVTFTARQHAAARVALGPLLADTGSGNLLLLQLSGGNDGLSMVVPHGDDAYHAARPSLAKQKDELFMLDDYRGLHASLAGGIAAWEAGELAIVEGVGYPNPNRSHFKSMDIWHTADPRGRDAGQGWIGRLADGVWKEDVEVNRIVHIGGPAPYSLNAETHGCAAFDLPEGYRWLDHDDGLQDYTDRTGGMAEAPGALAQDPPKRKPRKSKKADEKPMEEAPMDGGQGGGTLDAMRKVLSRARDSSEAVRTAALGYRTEVDYPRDTLGGSLRTAAALLKSSIGSRIVSVTYGGFDTHNDERNRHDRQMRELGAALAALRTDLAASEAGRATTILVFSEFGRRVTENGSGGTDHGTAGPVLVMGPRVKGGLYGKHPKLDKLEKGDMAFTTDFRRVYTDVAMELFAAEPDFLGAKYKRLGLFGKG